MSDVPKWKPEQVAGMKLFPPGTSPCEVCDGESGGKFVGVASVPGAPVSIRWCSECLKHNSTPAWIFEHDFVFVAEGEPDNLNEWARSRVTWADGHYVRFDNYVKRITPEEVERQLKEYEAACRKQNADAGPGEL